MSTRSGRRGPRAADESRPGRPHVVVGVDIGGTFTDLVLLSSGARPPALHKVLTTPEDPAEAVIRGVHDLLAVEGLRLREVALLVHGTTLATNARTSSRAGRDMVCAPVHRRRRVKRDITRSGDAPAELRGDRLGAEPERPVGGADLPDEQADEGAEERVARADPGRPGRARDPLAHLGEHLERLPESDMKSRAIVAVMKDDEARHADNALHAGAETLPVLPLVDEFRAAASPDVKLYWERGHGHWTPRGQEIAGDAIARAILQLNLIGADADNR